MSSTPPVDDRASDAGAASTPKSLPGTDDLEALLGANPAVQRSRERKARSFDTGSAEAPPPPSAPPVVGPTHESPSAAVPPKRSKTIGETIWRWLYPVGLVLLALLVPVFGLMGYNAILDSNDGNVTAPVTDPTATGFEVLVDPTPVTMMALVDGDNLVGVNVTSLARDDLGGTMLWLPPNTIVETDSLASHYAEGGDTALRDAVAAELTVDVGAVEVIGPDRWASLVEPVAPIVVDVPDALILQTLDGSSVVSYQSGQVALEPEQVGEYLAWLNPGERQINRLARQEAFFEAWLGQISRSDDLAAVPGEVETGLGRFVRGVASGPAITKVLPVTPLVGDFDLVQVTDPDAVSDVVSETVPLPVSPFPGARPVVKLLDGVGDQPRTLAAIDDLVLGGAQISVLGNNEAFGVSETDVRYHIPEAESAAEALAESLGVGQVRFSPTTTEGETVVIEVTVVIGSDYQPDQATG